MARLAQPLEAALCTRQVTVTHQEPRRLGRNQRNHKQRNGPRPLNGKGDAVAPLRLVGAEAIEHTRGNELPDAPAQIDISSQVPTQCQRRNLSCIGGARSRKHAPGDVAKEHADKHGLNGGREENDKDGADQEDERAHENFAVAVLGSEITVK